MSDTVEGYVVNLNLSLVEKRSKPSRFARFNGLLALPVALPDASWKLLQAEATIADIGDLV